MFSGIVNTPRIARPILARPRAGPSNHPFSESLAHGKPPGLNRCRATSIASLSIVSALPPSHSRLRARPGAGSAFVSRSKATSAASRVPQGSARPISASASVPTPALPSRAAAPPRPRSRAAPEWPFRPAATSPPGFIDTERTIFARPFEGPFGNRVRMLWFFVPFWGLVVGFYLTTPSASDVLRNTPGEDGDVDEKGKGKGTDE